MHCFLSRGCLPVLVNIFVIGKHHAKTLHDHRISMSINGRPCARIILTAGTNNEMTNRTNTLIDRSNAHGMVNIADKQKIMAKGNSRAEIYMNKVQLREVNSCKYLAAAVLTRDIFMADIRTRIATGWTGPTTAISSDILRGIHCTNPQQS